MSLARPDAIGGIACQLAQPILMASQREQRAAVQAAGRVLLALTGNARHLARVQAGETQSGTMLCSQA